tara:strand:- start:1096 stop:1524 length:429 start_codon:yes stop_codon:yes gene_type:complete
LNKKLSKKDKKNWEEFVTGKEKLPNKDKENIENEKIYQKSIDLHGYSLEKANKTIEDFINKCFSQNIKKIIVITGKGLHSNIEQNPYRSKDLSILKYSVPNFIKSDRKLMSKIKEISNAKIEDGGDGAFYIYLKKSLKNKFR